MKTLSMGRWRRWLTARALGLGLASATAAACAAHGAPTVAQVRHARATHDLERTLLFYRDGLGLPVLGGFEDHAGYDGVMIGLPGPERHLEFTTDQGRHPVPAPGPESLLVLYYPEQAERDAVVKRLARLGFAAVAPENPYWTGKAVTIPDPDGYRVVLFAGRWEPNPLYIPARFLAKPEKTSS